MKIRITHKNSPIDEQIRKFIEKKCKNLEKFTPRIEDVDVLVKVEKNYRWFAEINVPIRGGIIHGEAETGNLLSSFEEALNKVERQLKKRRKKIVEHKPKLSKPLEI
ncbi:MAG TPA: ribosome-associated translation inhibitor RaiA [Candidatus Omnitrophica bacterium]|nr:ribosome-associated translation inhibitor RaiA [Candidatus Omnitrophota bacterium]